MFRRSTSAAHLPPQAVAAHAEVPAALLSPALYKLLPTLAPHAHGAQNTQANYELLQPLTQEHCDEKFSVFPDLFHGNVRVREKRTGLDAELAFWAQHSRP